MQGKIIILLVVSILICLIPFSIYVIVLANGTFSQKISDWAAFGEYIGGTLNPIISILTLAVTAYIAVSFNEYQKKQNTESSIRQERLVRPLISILVGDYEEQIQVKLKNAGLGPLTIKEVTIFSPNNSNGYKNLIDLMPKHPEGLPWRDFVFKIEGRVIAVGAELNLLELTGEPGNNLFEDFKNKVRYNLKDVVIEITYTDIYENEMPKAIQLLDIYRRHFDLNKRHLNESKVKSRGTNKS